MARSALNGRPGTAGDRHAPRPEIEERPVNARDDQTVRDVRTLADLARVLRELRRRHARQLGVAELTYRDIAAKTGWSHGIIGDYFSGKVLPPTDRFDALVRILGASPAELGPLATARDLVEEIRRGGVVEARAPQPLQLAPPVPRQLPARAYGFTGRTDELKQLDALLDETERTAAVVVSAVSGTAGVGKTTLAVQWAHRIAARFPDGQLYVDLRGYDPDEPVAPAAALAAFLRALGVPGAEIPTDLDERSAHFRTLLADRRMLVVLDNARTADQVRPLLPGAASCFVIVTSRDDLAGLVAREGARRIELDVLGEAESLSLLRTLIGSRVAAEPGSAHELTVHCGRLPLALRVAAELAAAQPGVSLTDLIGQLRDEQRRLDVLDASGDPRTAVRTVFSWSYRHLSTAGARAFALLGLHPGTDFDQYSLAALADTTTVAAQALLDELSRAHLIAPAGAGVTDGCRMHDLLRAYSRERATVDVHAGERRAALTRLFEYYLATASSAMDTLFPHDRPQRPGAAPARTPVPSVSDSDHAGAWLERERTNLVSVCGFAAHQGWPRTSIDLSQTLWRYYEVRGHFHEALQVHTSAVAAGRYDEHAKASVLANLGNVHWWLGSYRDALRTFEQALADHRQARDAGGEARALARLGIVHERLGNYPESLECLGEALALYRGMGDRHGEGAQLVNLGTMHRRLGRYDEAARHQELAAEVFHELGDARLEGYALGNLGAVYGLLGRYTEALTYLERALCHCRDSGDRGGEGSALATIGGVYARLDRHSEALHQLRQALAISREVSDRSLETETLNAIGEVLRATRHADAALRQHQAALSLTDHTGDRYEHARALEGCAEALHAAGQAGAADEYRRQALRIYTELRVPEADRVRAAISTARP
jgi:tetratricopeptide (TPR) repeat protein